MPTYQCLKCATTVRNRETHSATAIHQANGGSAAVVDSDYNSGEGTISPSGTSKVR